MNVRCLATVVLALLPALAAADVDPVTIRIPEPTAWTGQRLPIFVELRVRGSFDGATSFSLPQVPRTILIQLDNPVVSSQEIDGASWFVQTHEFALFSQQTGTVEIPPFEVRFSSRDGFTGPSKPQKATVPAAKVQIRRPPGSDKLGFLVTTDAIDVSEAWEPKPGPAEAGAVFQRTISQHADEMTGMALAPPSQSAPAGVRVYLADPKVDDDVERGDFSGQRTDVVTYVMQEPGTHTLPAISYVWWDPKSQQIQSKTLPAVTFEVAAPPVVAPPDARSSRRSGWIWWCGGVGLITAIGVWQWRRIMVACRSVRHWLIPPERVAVWKLRRACRRNDVAAASHAWLHWLELQEPGFVPSASLNAAVIDLQRHLYGRPSSASWHGDSLKHALDEQTKMLVRKKARRTTDDLPSLNPV